MIYEIGVPANCDGDGNVMNALDAIKQSGIKHVMPVNRSPEFEAHIKRALELGLSIPYAHLEFSNANYLWAKGMMNRNYIETTIASLKLCAQHNIPIAIMHAVMGDPAITAVKPTKQGLKSMKEILAAAERYNVKIALENTNHQNRKNFEYLMNNIKSPWLGFCYDCGHHLLYTPKTNLMKKYGDRCIAVHLHDNFLDYKKGHDWTRDLHVLPFDGKLNLDKVAKEIAQSSYNDIIMIESYHLSFGLPQLYKDLTLDEFLHLLKSRGEKLGDLIKKYKNQTKPL